MRRKVTSSLPEAGPAPGPGALHLSELNSRVPGHTMRRFWLFFSQSVTVLLAAYFVVATLKPEWIGKGASTIGRGVSVVEARSTPTTVSGPPPAGSFRLAATAA